MPVVGAPAPVPAGTPVAGDVALGQDPVGLLNRAIALSAPAPSSAPLQAMLAQSQRVLNAQSVRASQAGIAAVAASAAAARAGRAAEAAAANAASLQSALRDATLRLYTGGGSSVVPAHPGQTADELANAAAYESTLLSPDGILAARRAQAGAARLNAAEQVRQEALAGASRASADQAVTAATAATNQLRAELAGLDAATATLVSSERQSVSTQAGKALVSGTALEFTPTSALPPPPPTTSVALAWAFSELGKPYLWGGTGPDQFDCSGLTQFSWAKAGVSIPRVAADQDAFTIPVPLSQLLPGDLVFFGTTDIHHVGMYIGNGLMVNAPHTGDVIRVSSIWWSDLSGFGRVHSAGVPVPSRVLPAPATPGAAVVLPAAGSVPSQSTPPPGYVAPPGATAPVAPSPTAPGATSPTTSTAPPSTATGILTPPAATTTTSSTTQPPASTTTAPLLIP